MNCVFCSIVSKEIKALVVGENDHALAFLDINPISDGHTVIISKKHYKNMSTCPSDVLNSVMDLSKEMALKIESSNLKPWGFNYLSNEGSAAGQEIMHFHFHVIPKYAKNEGFKIGIGKRFVDDVNEVYKKITGAKSKKK